MTARLERCHIQFWIILPFEPGERPQAEEDQQASHQKTGDRHQPGVHEPKPSSDDVGLTFLEDSRDFFAALGREVVSFEGFQTLKPVLMKNDDQRNPDQRANQDRLARHLECRVLEDEPVHQHDQANGGLEQEAHASDSGGLLIGEMVGSHEPRSE